MANEFYTPIQYPTFQYAVPASPLQGAVEAYTTGLNIAQRKQQAEIQKQQLEMQKQQMAMSEKRFGMEEKREERAAEEWEAKKKLNEMDQKDKQDTLAFYKSAMDIFGNRPDLPTGTKLQMAQQMAMSSGKPKLMEWVDTYVKDVVNRTADPGEAATILNTVYGSNITPQQILAERSKISSTENVITKVSPTGEVTQEISDWGKARLAKEEEQAQVSRAHLDLAKQREARMSEQERETKDTTMKFASKAAVQYDKAQKDVTRIERAIARALDTNASGEGLKALLKDAGINIAQGRTAEETLAYLRDKELPAAKERMQRAQEWFTKYGYMVDEEQFRIQNPGVDTDTLLGLGDTATPAPPPPPPTAEPAPPPLPTAEPASTPNALDPYPQISMPTKRQMLGYNASPADKERRRQEILAAQSAVRPPVLPVQPKVFNLSAPQAQEYIEQLKY